MADTTKKASVQIVNEEQENMAVTEVETTEEENKTLIRMNEDDFIQGLISAADYAKDDTHQVREKQTVRYEITGGNEHCQIQRCTDLYSDG